VALHRIADRRGPGCGVNVRQLEQITLKAINDPAVQAILPLVDDAQS